MNCAGKWLASRQIRCNWATKGAGTNEDKQSSNAKSVVELTNGSSGESRFMLDITETTLTQKIVICA